MSGQTIAASIFFDDPRSVSGAAAVSSLSVGRRHHAAEH
jgi:hypothetical protein